MDTSKTISEIKEDRTKFKYPMCDNCRKEITTTGRYVWRDGKTIYVHIKYNERTRKCNLTEPF